MADPFEYDVSYPDPAPFPPEHWAVAEPEPVSFAPPPEAPAPVDPFAPYTSDPSQYALPEPVPEPPVVPKKPRVESPYTATVQQADPVMYGDKSSGTPAGNFPPSHWRIGADRGGGPEYPWTPTPTSDAPPTTTGQPAPYRSVFPQGEADYAGAQKRARRMGAEGLAIDDIQREHERTQLGIEARRRAYVEDDEARRQSLRVLEDAEAAGVKERDDLLAEAKALASTPIDRGRWLRNQSTGQRIAGFADAMIQGWMNPTGKNSGVEFILGEIDKDVDDQVRDLENRKWGLGERRGLVAEMLASGRSLHQIRDVARMAALEQAERMVTLDMAQYDPAGSLAAQKRKVQLAFQQARAQAAAAAQERARKQHMQDIEFQMKVDEHNQKMSRGGLSPDEYAKEQERMRTQGVANTSGDRGQKLIWKGDEAAKIGNASKKATDTVVGLIDEIDELRDDENATSDWVNSPENQRQIQLGAELLLQLKEQYKLGAISGTDAELLEDVRGFKSATQYRNFLPKLRQLRANIERSHGDVLRTYATNQDGSDYTGTFSIPTRAQERDTSAREIRGVQAALKDKTPRTNLQALDAAAKHISTNPSLLGDPSLKEDIDKATAAIANSNDPQLIEAYDKQVKPKLDAALKKANEKNAPKKEKPRRGGTSGSILSDEEYEQGWRIYHKPDGTLGKYKQ